VYNWIGVLSDISRVLAEQGIDIVSLTSALSKQGMATITVSFETAGVEEIGSLIGKLRQIDSVVDIERNAG
jgi:GTP pyrophosphokinase